MNSHVSVHGTYLLLLECDRQAELSIGKLGHMMTQPGFYLYVGSAFGPGGIQARINHHAQIALRPHWHIDYLRTKARFAGAWCVYGFRYEHEWAQALDESDDTVISLIGFGSSDCKCITHLFYMKLRPDRAVMENLLKCKLASVNISSLD